MPLAEAIVLGTVQFGLPYGVANKSGQLSDEQAEETMHIARYSGIRMLDTAVSYGESEARLGLLGVKDMKVMTKLPPVPSDCMDVRGWVQSQVAGSLERLRLSRLHGLSFHRPEQLLEGAGRELYDAVCCLKKQGVVDKIGVSIYQPEELERLLADHEFDMVQAPFSLFDRRLISSGWVDRLNALGCELHVRSVFLQGLLLMTAADRPVYFHRWQSLLYDWDSWLLEVGLSPLQACLRYVLSVPGIAKIVVGVDSPRQLEDVLSAAAGPAPAVPARLCSVDLDLLNPSRWLQA